MAAVGAQEAQVGRLDVLQFGGDRAVSGLEQRRQNQVQELRNARLTSGGREAFKACLNLREEETPYRPDSNAQFMSRFGAGEARYDASSRTVTREPVSPEKKAVYDEAKRLIQESTQVMTYLEVLGSADANATFTALKQARPELANVASVRALRDAALDSIARDGTFQRMFPELFARGAGTNATARRAIIEDTLARDPRFMSRLSARMETIYESAQKLSEVTANPQLEAARQASQTEYDGKAKQVADALRKAGVNTLPPANAAVSEASVKALIDANGAQANPAEAIIQAITGVDVNAALRAVAANPAAQAALQNGDFDAIRQALPAMTTEQVQALQNFRINLDNTTLPNVGADAVVTAFLTGKGGSVVALDANDLARQILDTWNVANNTNGFANPGEVARAKAYARVILNQNNGSATLLRDTLTDADTANKKLKTAESNLKNDPEAMRSDRMRLVEETKLLHQLESVLGNALVDVMEDRYDQMIPLEEERIAKAAKQAEEAKKDELARRIRQLGQTKSRRWVEYNRNQRRKSVHRDHIQADMQDIIYASNQEEQIKQMLMRDSGYAITVFKDANGQEQTIAQGMRIDLLTGTVRNAQNQELGKADLSTLNELYKSEKDSYVQKLFGDYFASRRFYDRSINMLGMSGSTGMGIRDHEWVLLEQQYGNQVTEALAQDQQGRAVIDRLKSEGVIADFKLKWLLYLLFMAGGAVALGPAGLALGGLGAAALGGSGATVLGGGLAGSTLGALGGSRVARGVSDRIH